MVESKNPEDKFADDVFDEFENSIGNCESLRNLIEEIESDRIKGDYRFRKVTEEGFDGFDIKLKVRIPTIKGIRIRGNGRGSMTMPMEVVDKGDEIVVVGAFPVKSVDEIAVKVEGQAVLVKARSGLRKRVPLQGVDRSEAPRLTLRNGILEIRLRKSQ